MSYNYLFVHYHPSEPALSYPISPACTRSSICDIRKLRVITAQRTDLIWRQNTNFKLGSLAQQMFENLKSSDSIPEFY